MFEFCQTVKFLIYFNGSCFLITVLTMLVKVNYSIFIIISIKLVHIKITILNLMQSCNTQ